MRWTINSGFVAGVAMMSAAMPASAAGPFDGTWNVVVFCDRASDGAAAYTLRFPAQIREGSVFGQFRTTGGAEISLTGMVQPSGEARLTADGRTGSPEYTVGHVQAGSPYHYTANGRFGPTSGSATRNELRPCSLSFTRG